MKRFSVINMKFKEILRRQNSVKGFLELGSVEQTKLGLGSVEEWTGLGLGCVEEWTRLGLGCVEEWTKFRLGKAM